MLSFRDKSQESDGRCALIRAQVLIMVDMVSLDYTELQVDSNWALTGEKLSSGVCEQQSRGPACASAQSDKRLCY